jgi:hypothetical protein
MKTTALSADGINYMNIGLMALSLIMAVTFPFELFLFAYAVLGPLHYMTEIGWLHQRNYFAIQKKDILIPTLFCSLLLVSLLLGLSSRWEVTAAAAADLRNGFLKPVITCIDRHGGAFIFLAFSSSVCMVTLKKPVFRYPIMAAMAIPAFWLSGGTTFETWFSIFLPTIIHVCVFTALFILFGALKAKSMSGYASFGFYILCGLIIFGFHFDPKKYPLTGYILEAFNQSGFSGLNRSMWDILAPHREKQFFLNSVTGLKIQSFVAFAYTYHYLNWFSKTEVIRWHAVPKPWLIFTVIVWVSAVGLYLYDYYVGLLTLFFLSMLHVFMEFPLNIQSIKGIGTELASRMGWANTSKS